MLLQTDERFPQRIRDYGCYFMALLYFGEQNRGTQYDIDEVIAILHRAQEANWINYDMYVKRPADILRAVGLNISDRPAWRSALHKAQPNELEILYYKRDQPSHEHFVAAKNGVVVYDPMGESQTVKFGRLVSKRIFEVL